MGHPDWLLGLGEQKQILHFVQDDNRMVQDDNRVVQDDKVG